jgi:predicted O-methyltransferase YrrM
VFKAPLADKISVITGLAAESLEQKLRSKTPPLDFIFLDADRSSYPEYLRLTPKLSRPGTVIVWTNLSGRSNLQNRKRVVFFNTHTPVARYLRAF